MCAGSGGRVSTDWLYTGPASGQAAPPDDVIPVHWHWPLSVLASLYCLGLCTDVNIALCLQFNTCSMLLSSPWSAGIQSKAGVRMPKLTPGWWLPVLAGPLTSPPTHHADTMPDPSTRWGDSATISTVMSGSTHCFRSFKWSYPSILKDVMIWMLLEIPPPLHGRRVNHNCTLHNRKECVLCIVELCYFVYCVRCHRCVSSSSNTG